VPEDAPRDPFAAQKANIRDTAKYMAAAYVACGTVIFAGSSLSGIGNLPPERLLIVLGAAGLALVCVIVGIKQVLDLLITDFVFASELPRGAESFIDTHRVALLPGECRTYGELWNARMNASKALAQARADYAALPPPGDPGRQAAEQQAKSRCADAQQTLAAYDTWLTNTMGAVQLHLLREQLLAARGTLAALTLVAMIGAGIAVFFMSKPKPSECFVTVSWRVDALAGVRSAT
jgi:hypothetical protein